MAISPDKNWNFFYLERRGKCKLVEYKKFLPQEL